MPTPPPNPPPQAGAGLKAALARADAAHLDGRLSEAIDAYQEVLRLDPSIADAWYGLGCALLTRQVFGAAAAALRRAQALAPDAAAVCYNLGKSLFQLGEVDAAIAQFHLAARDEALAGLVRRSLACIVPGSAATDNAGVLAARRDWAMQDLDPGRTAPRPRPPGRLRIGYLSAFFAAPNWMKPVWGLINHHDRMRFEIHLFADGALPMAESGYRDWPDDTIHNITGVAAARVAEIIAGAGIDILVDLNAYSAQDRLALLTLRPAPVIVGWFNHFATTGIDAVDWLVGDAQVIPPDEDPYYVERIHRLPGSYLAFEVLYPVPEVAPPPALAAGHITFGCLGAQYKLTDPVLAAWAVILRAAPTSRLLLGNAALGDESTRAALRARLDRQGAPLDRVDLLGGAAHVDFLRIYDRIDIALDSFPYNGGTTTTEALWQGVPVLCFSGDRWVARTSRSLLTAAGLSDWVMADADAYVRRAIALAQDPATPTLLAGLRAGMRARLRAAPVCDATELCRSMETFYLEVSPRIFS